MSETNQLCFKENLALNDQVPVYSMNGGVTQRTSINQILLALSQLPTVQPVTGSGELWLNNGVVTVA